MSERLTVGSLFSGIGGLELGLERAGMEVRWQVEIEDYPRRVLEKHWPDVPKYRDVREVGAHNLEPVDLICGGFPCQDISYAGKGAGLEGERSGLWWEFARVIREMGPRYVLVENVPALLTRGIDAVLGTLASFGYDAEWDCIPAAAVGAPHLRDRAFVVAYPGGGAPQLLRGPGQLPSPAGAAEGEARERQRGGDAARNSSEAVADHSGDGRGQGRARRFDSGGPGQPEQPLPIPDPHRWQREVPGNDAGVGGKREPDPHGGPGVGAWGVEPNVGRVADGVPSRVDRLRALGNAVVPQVSEWIGERIVAADARLREHMGAA